MLTRVYIACDFVWRFSQNHQTANFNLNYVDYVWKVSTLKSKIHNQTFELKVTFHDEFKNVLIMTKDLREKSELWTGSEEPETHKMACTRK